MGGLKFSGTVMSSVFIFSSWSIVVLFRVSFSGTNSVRLSVELQTWADIFIYELCFMAAVLCEHIKEPGQEFYLYKHTQIWFNCVPHLTLKWWLWMGEKHQWGAAMLISSSTWVALGDSWFRIVLVCCWLGAAAPFILCETRFFLSVLGTVSITADHVLQHFCYFFKVATICYNV